MRRDLEVERGKRGGAGRRAVYPGTFDPVTNGHIDLIRRALEIFDDLVVGVAVNPDKGTLFSVQERVEMLRMAAAAGRLRARVEPFDDLVVNFARAQKAGVIIRGLRMLSDFEYEFQMALTNRKLAPRIETAFMMPSEEHSYISSRLIKEVAGLGADVRSFVPAFVAKRLREKLGSQ
ncbi:MAG: pantetheine-phosphate adenylyltransferase [Candidatus Omnitrophica bacterium]|nr:pantetheine-phosphate adenylyltransferase [Candidatus Omnitrophota bacterium]